MKKTIKLFLLFAIVTSCNDIKPSKSDIEISINKTESIVLENFKYLSSGDMNAFQTTISSDFKFILTGTLKFNDGKPFSRTYDGYDSFINDFLTPALETMPNGLKFIFDKLIANKSGAALIWHGESEALYDTYNNRYVYIYEVNEDGLVSSITEYTDLLLSASSLLGQKINTNYKEKTE